MAENRGKIWEKKFLEDWKKSFPNTFLFRIPDQVTGYKTTSQNPCDYIAFVDNLLFLIECKSHKGASIPFDAIPQYERLLAYEGMKDVIPGVIVWFMEKDRVIWVPLNTMTQMKKDGEKSIKLSKLYPGSNYYYLEIPAKKLRVFMQCDYKLIVDRYSNCVLE